MFEKNAFEIVTEQNASVGCNSKSSLNFGPKFHSDILTFDFFGLRLLLKIGFFFEPKKLFVF